MKVKELIAQLEKVDPELEVAAYIKPNLSLVNAMEVVRGPDYLKIAEPLFVKLTTHFSGLGPLYRSH